MHDLDIFRPSWQARAACRGAMADGLDWFPETGKRATRELQICGVCPVRIDCLEFALASNEEHGTWGGHSGKSLRNLRRLRALRERNGEPPISAEHLEALLHPTQERAHDAA